MTLEKSRFGSVLQWGIFLLSLVVLAVVVFHAALSPEAVLFTSDDNIGEIMVRKINLPQGFRGHIKDFPLLGVSDSLTFTWTNILIWLLPVKVFCSCIHLIDLVIASIFFAAFLRQRKIGWLGCFLGVMTAFWLGTNLTLAYAGHIGKYGVMMFSMIALFCLEKTACSRRWYWPVLSGGALGFMMLEQQDLALFIGIFLGAYAIYAMVRESGWNWKVLMAKCVGLGAIAVLLAGGVSWMKYLENSQGIDITENRSPQEQWDFATQWSVPVDEFIDFVAPGYMGWRSSDPEGPYWGRTGRSANWEQTRQGFPNFRLEGVYLGIIPFMLGVFALFAAFGGVEKDRKVRGDVIFWLAALVLSLLLSYGRYFPLYRAFFQLPMMSSIRNPNKFLHVFQVALGVLAAGGLSRLLCIAREGDADLRMRVMKRFVWPLAGVSALFFVWGLIGFGSTASLTGRFTQEGWGQYAPVIAGNITRAVLHGSVLALLCTGVVWGVTTPRIKNQRARAGLGIALLVIVVLDIMLLAQHYITPFDVESNVGDTAVVKFLKKNLDEQRVYTLDQGSFYNQWFSMAFPYQGIPAFNVMQMPRMPADYKRYLQQFSQNPMRLWELSAVKYVFAPEQAWQQIQRTPGFRDALSPAFGFNVMADGNGMSVVEASSYYPAKHWILEYKDALPRFSLIGDWQIVDDEGALTAMGAQDFEPQNTVVVPPESAELLPAQKAAGNIGTVKVLDYMPAKMKLEVDAAQDGVLLAVSHYDAGWQAWLDGERVPLFRCNFLCQGVTVPAGKHELTLVYVGNSVPLYLELVGLAVILVALLVAFVQGFSVKREV